MLAEVRSLLGAHSAEHDVMGRMGEALDAGLSSPEDPDRWIGVMLGGFRIVGFVGRGGMGSVYRAEPPGGGESVAIKVLHGASRSKAASRRFDLERDRLRCLEHSYIPSLLSSGVTPEGDPFYAMDFVEGQAIDVHSDERRLNIPERICLMLEVGLAVTHAHEHQIIHRDLKPSNILVRASAEPSLLDFGIAKLLDPIHMGEPTTLTRDVRAFTPEYASPEQIEGEAVSPASDVYSLGAVGYRLFAGSPPGIGRFAAPCRPREVFESHGDRMQEVAAARATTVNELTRVLQGDLGRVLLRACDPHIARRYQSVDDLSGALRQCIGPVHPLRSALNFFQRRRRPW